VVAKRIEGLNDIILPSFSVLRVGRQRTHMGAQVLSPIIDVLRHSGLVRVPSHPSPNVLREPHVELREILGNDKSILSDVVSVNEHDRIARVFLFGGRTVLLHHGGLHCHVFHRRYRVAASDLTRLVPMLEASRAARTLSFSSVW